MSRAGSAARIGARAAITGTVANLVLTAALAALARAEGRHPLRALNAPSHWLNGPEAGRTSRADLRHTGTGLLTDHAASIFWAVPLEVLSDAEDRSPGQIARDAALVAAAAGAIDYGILPRKAAPGWERALPARSVALAFGALALGLAAGAMISRRVVR